MDSNGTVHIKYLFTPIPWDFTNSGIFHRNLGIRRYCHQVLHLENKNKYLDKNVFEKKEKIVKINRKVDFLPR
jgi:hypothetical protein